MAQTEISWEIEQLKYAKVSGELENVILEVFYKLIAWYDMTVPDETDNLDENFMIIDPTKTTTIQNGVTVHGSIKLDPPSDNFTPIDILHKNIVVQWVKDKLGPTQVSALEEAARDKRANLIDTNIERGRPAHWDPVL
jgi:hypothetical protein